MKTHPIVAQVSESGASALLDAGRLINHSRLGVCNCQSCIDFRKSTTLFAQVAQHFYKCGHGPGAGMVLRALVEEWSISRIIEEFNMREVVDRQQLTTLTDDFLSSQ